MKLVKVAAAALNQTPLDWQRNYQNIIEAIELARQQQVSILCLPELCISGYGCEDAFHSPGLQTIALHFLQKIVPETDGMIVSVGLPILYAGGLFNTAALLVDGQIVGFAAKQHLAGDGIHYEPRWFKPWPRSITGELSIDGRKVPIGNILFDVGGIRIGFEICEDAWVGTRPGANFAAKGADVILNPSASHFAFQKHSIRQRFVLEGSRAFHVTYVYSNLLGNESGRAIFDGDTMIASGGQMLAMGKRFSYQSVCLTTATVDVDLTRMGRARMGSFAPGLVGDESDVVFHPFKFPPAQLAQNQPAEDHWAKGPHPKFEEFTRAVSLGLFDYLRKSHSRGFVVSLSGGCDSASVATLVTTMMALAQKDLGFEKMVERLGDWLKTESASRPDDLMPKMLTTVYQATKNSGPVTRQAAAVLANALNSTHYEFDVEPLVQKYTHIVSDAIGQPLTWQHHDISLQNIQSRVRAPGVWMLANLKQALLLSTSNRSEAAVGYATMDGDTSGGLSPIAGIDKAFLIRWLKWMETTGPEGLFPIPALKDVNDQQPTAELRPPDHAQTDEKDLMPYEVLDEIELFAIRDKMMPVEVYQHLKLKFANRKPDDLKTWTIRFFTLWGRNQWKRERYAPSFHLDDESLDPKTWCRFPILSGCYQHEIQQLESFCDGD